MLITIFALVFSSYAQNAPEIADFSAMAGCWEKVGGSDQISEQWMKPAGNSMIGAGRTVENGKISSYEFMRLEGLADGVYFYAQPKGNPKETPFKLIKWNAGEFVFENLQNDFPQRVIYKPGKDRMQARIEGSNKGKPMAFDFPFKRVSCD